MWGQIWGFGILDFGGFGDFGFWGFWILGILDFEVGGMKKFGCKIRSKFWILHKSKKTVHASPGRRICLPLFVSWLVFTVKPAEACQGPRSEHESDRLFVTRVPATMTRVPRHLDGASLRPYSRSQANFLLLTFMYTDLRCCEKPFWVLA